MPPSFPHATNLLPSIGLLRVKGNPDFSCLSIVVIDHFFEQKLRPVRDKMGRE